MIFIAWNGIYCLIWTVPGEDIFVRSIRMALSAMRLIELIIVLIAAPDARAALLAGPGFGCGRG